MDRSEEALARRAMRQARRRAAKEDVLAERVRCIKLWRDFSETNKQFLPFRGAWWHPFVNQPGLRRLLMPRLRARIEQRHRDARDRYAAELRESAARFAVVKAERAAAKARAKAPQMDLLDEVSTC